MTNSTRSALIAALLACFAVMFAALAFASKDPTIEELKARVDSAPTGDRPRLCLQIAERQLEAASKSFAADQGDEAKTSLTDVVSFSELARDNALQSHKHQKQTEIAVRSMTRKLNDLKHRVAHDDQPAIQDAIDRLQRVRDDLLLAMFPHGRKGNK
jgi:hypothetical protein